MALARVNKYVKENLKRSVSCFFYCVIAPHFTNLSTWQQPLRNTKAGEGKRSRDVEDYLKGLLKVIHQGVPTPIQGDESDENDTTVAALSRRKRFFSSLRSDVVN